MTLNSLKAAATGQLRNRRRKALASIKPAEPAEEQPTSALQEKKKKNTRVLHKGDVHTHRNTKTGVGDAGSPQDRARSAGGVNTEGSRSSRHPRYLGRNRSPPAPSPQAERPK